MAVIKQALISVSDKTGVAEFARGLAGSAAFRHAMNQFETRFAQTGAVNDFFAQLAERGQRLTYVEELAA